MNILTNIEDQITILLQTINKDVIDGYTYKTYTGTVDIYDDTLSDSLNEIDPGIVSPEYVVNYEVEPDARELAVEFTEGTFAITNEVDYRIRCRVKNTGDESRPKQSISNKMNDVLSDIKFLFGNNIDLNKTCNWFLYKESTKNYSDDDDLINTGYIDIIYTLNYSQSVLNTDNIACW